HPVLAGDHLGPPHLHARLVRRLGLGGGGLTGGQRSIIIRLAGGAARQRRLIVGPGPQLRFGGGLVAGRDLGVQFGGDRPRGGVLTGGQRSIIIRLAGGAPRQRRLIVCPGPQLRFGGGLVAGRDLGVQFGGDLPLGGVLAGRDGLVGLVLGQSRAAAGGRYGE